MAANLDTAIAADRRLAPSRAYRDAAARAAGTAPLRKATPADAFDTARRWFLDGQRIEMQTLASELAVSRATLYRWTGQREQLLGDVIWSLAQELLGRHMREAQGTGAERILNVFDGYVSAIAKAPALRRFLETDAEVALRVLTMRGGPVQGRIVAALADLIREEAERGAYTPRVDSTVLAYAIVRIGEAFLYNDAIIALDPDLDQAKAIVQLLLD